MLRVRGMLAAAAAAILLIAGARAAFALWVQVPVTRSGPCGQHTIRVKSRDGEGYKRYEVSLTPRGHPISPFTSAELTLIAKGGAVAVVPVSEEHEQDRLVWRFRVAPAAIERSYLNISEGNYEPFHGTKSPFGKAVVDKQPVEEVMGGMMYRINLVDFAVSAQR